MQGDPYNGWNAPEWIVKGRHSYGEPSVITYEQHGECRVVVGNFCSIAADVVFLLDGEHRVDFITTSPLQNLGHGLPPGHNRGKGSIEVGHDVWIARGATILSGVTIATGAVIGAYAVVASDVDPYSVVVGNPARQVRLRFTTKQIARLLTSRWWDAPDERIIAALPLLWASDVDRFLDGF